MTRCLVVLAPLGCVAVGSVSPAQAYTAPPPSPASICVTARVGAELAVEHMQLEPANGSTVPAGTPVVFSAESLLHNAPTFNVASSEALLSSPDIDSGMGSQSGAFYEFTSAKATATPRTIYWTASFTFTPEDCEVPSTFTTPMRTLVVVESQAEILGRLLAEGAPTREAERQAKAAKEQSEREAAASHKKEEEAAPKKKKQAEPPDTGGIALAGTTIAVQADGVSLVKLNCLGIALCHGKLTLGAKHTVKGKDAKDKKARSVSIGTADFAISGDEATTVKMNLNAAGRALLGVDHGRLGATLAILELGPGPESNSQTKTVQLVQQKPHGKTKKGSLA
jgi:hypothetical protein